MYYFFCCDSHHLGHCSGPLLPLGVRLYEPVNSGFAAPCSKDPLHHPWCEDHCWVAMGHGGGGGVPTDCIWRIGVGLGTVAGAWPSARRDEDVFVRACALHCQSTTQQWYCIAAALLRCICNV